jgi:glycosyltransferase involved in cell wall biosynthesis
MPTLGLAMIVRNGGEALRRCLQSVQGVVSELVVVDTGSTDNSREIARECGAACASIAWGDDFSQARNAALKLSTTDWIVTLDADEELDGGAKQRIPRLLKNHSVAGYAVPIRNYLPARHGSINGNRARANDGRCVSAKDAPAFAEHLVVRLFRHHPQIRYKGCVHEAVAPQILAAGLKLAPANFCIHHLGFLATAQHEGKAEFYLRLLRKKVEQEPSNPMAWLELARQLHEPFRMNKEALLCLDRSLSLAPGMAGAALLAGLVNLDLGRNQEALAALKLAESDGESAAEREHCRGDAFHNLGRLKESQAAYQGCLQLIGHDPQIESKLGYVEVKLGDRSGFLRIQNALAELPFGAELHERLIKAYLAAGMLSEAADAAEKFASILMHPKTVLRAAAIRVHLKQDERARNLIWRGLQFFPESDELKHAQAELAGAGEP